MPKKTIWIVIGSISLPILLIGAMITTVAIQWFTPVYESIIVVRSADCRTAQSTGYVLLQISVSADSSQLSNYDLDRLEMWQLDPPEVAGLTFVGAATLPPGANLDALSPDDLGDLEQRLDGGQQLDDLTAEPVNLILEFYRTPRDAPITLDAITFSWAPGERGFKQEVPLKLQWNDDSCVVSTI